MKKRVVSVMSSLIGMGIGAVAVGKIKGNQVNKWKELSDKHLTLFLLMNQWVKIKQEGKNLADYFQREGYREIAIYGMSFVGETLVDELAESNVKIKYAIDKRANDIYEAFDVISPEEEMEKVDAIVVTSVTYFDEIQEMLNEKIDCPVLSLEDILYEV